MNTVQFKNESELKKEAYTIINDLLTITENKNIGNNINIIKIAEFI
jgi:hypothetical protein